MVTLPTYSPMTAVGSASRRISNGFAEASEEASRAALEKLFVETSEALARFERLYPDREVRASFGEARLEVCFLESSRAVAVTAYRTISFG